MLASSRLFYLRGVWKYYKEKKLTRRIGGGQEEYTWVTDDGKMC